MNWFNGDLTERDLLDALTGHSMAGLNLSEVEGKSLAWEYARDTGDGIFFGVPREEATCIALYIRGGKTFLPLCDGFAGREDCRDHPAIRNAEDPDWDGDAPPCIDLKARRQQAGLTQEELAAAAGIALRALRAYEQGTRPLDKAAAGTVLKIARAIGCSVEELLPDV